MQQTNKIGFKRIENIPYAKVGGPTAQNPDVRGKRAEVGATSQRSQHNRSVVRAATGTALSAAMYCCAALL